MPLEIQTGRVWRAAVFSVAALALAVPAAHAQLTYYPNNQLQTYAGPDGLTVTYGYDAAGQLERVSIPGEGAISVTEWQWSARQKVVLPGGSEQRFEHDGLLMPTRLKVVNPGQSTVFELEEKYGKLHEVGEVKRDGAATTYTYDAAYRLTRVQGPSAGYGAAFNEGYTVDAAGNRLSDSRVAAGATWVYDNAHQLTQRGSVGYAYDPNGNLVGKTDTALAEPRRTTTYTYDPQNRLSEVRDGAGTLLARYQYDPFDRRLSKQLAEGAAPNNHLGTPQRIADNGGAVVWAAEKDGFGRATVRSTAINPAPATCATPATYISHASTTRRGIPHAPPDPSSSRLYDCHGLQPPRSTEA